MRTLRGTVVIGAAGLLVAGCGGSSSGSPEAAPTSSGASVSQWASVVAKQAPKLKRADAQFGGCIPDQPTCGLYVLSLTFPSKTLALSLSNPDLGEPPAEVADLVASTVADARAVAKAGNAADDHATGGTYGELSLASSRLMTDLAGWKPYGV